MLKKVYNNVEDQRLLDGSDVVEDVTSVSLPTVGFSTSTVNASGMAGAVDMPNPSKVEAMELSVAHNNGHNCEKLSAPGKHMIELRVARQMYDVAEGDLKHEGMKVRATCVFKSNEKGTIEAGNPYGSTAKFSVLRYEEILNGVQVMLVDLMAGKIVVNGKSYTDEVENLLK